MRAVVGIDAGGTKTAGVLASEDGRVLRTVAAGPANWQSVGRVEAARVYREVWDGLAAAARDAGAGIAAAAWGLAGLDRPRDEGILEEAIRGLGPAGAARAFVNDTFLVLRAGTADGAGVAVVSGTGSNCVGVGPEGESDRIGGLGGEFGDDGSASDVGAAGLRAAFRGEDGRGAPTLLSRLVHERLEVERLDDLVDRFVEDAAPGERLQIGEIAPLVFEAAERGDAVALEILRTAGRELGVSARVLARRLFPKDAAFPLVLGGAVLQKGAVPAMRDALVAEVRGGFPEVRPVVLEAPPVLGAVLLALDRLASGGLASPETARRLEEDLR